MKKMFKQKTASNSKHIVGKEFILKPIEELQVGSLVLIEFWHSIRSTETTNNENPYEEIRYILLDWNVIHKYIVEKTEIKYEIGSVFLYDIVNNRRLRFDASFLGYYSEDPLSLIYSNSMFNRMEKAIKTLSISSPE